jgi:hypothetical protein
MSDSPEEPGLVGDIRRILSGIRTLQLDVVAIRRRPKMNESL